MQRRTVLTGIFGSALTAAMAGCVVQNDPYAPPPQQNYPPVGGPPRRLRIGGVWAFQDERGRQRFLEVTRERGGIVVSRGERSVFYERVGPGVFRDERGRVYQFFSDVEGVFENPRNGRRLRLYRA